MSTPVPTEASVLSLAPSTTWSGSEALNTASWREYPRVFAFAMLWLVTSRAPCWASRPRSVVSSPKNVEICGMALGLEGQDVVLAGRGRCRAVRAVADLRLAGEQPHE